MTNSQLRTFGWGTTPAELVQQQPGFLAVDSVHGTEGIGVVVAYWKDAESIPKWKQHLAHLEAQKQGRQRWYKSYQVRVAKVERAYGFVRGADLP